MAVVFTFLEEIEESAAPGISTQMFSFAKSREMLKEYEGSLADAVVEERRNAE